MSLYKNIGKLKSPYSFRTYLYRVIVAKCATHNSRAPRPAEGLETYEEKIMAPEIYTPEAQADLASESEAMREVIARLPQSQRDAVYLHYYGDLSYSEIASALGVTTTTVGTNIMKAKRKLRDQLGQRVSTPAIALSLVAGAQLQVPDARLAAVAQTCDQLIAAHVPVTTASTSVVNVQSAGARNPMLLAGILALVLISGAFVLYGSQTQGVAVAPATDSFAPFTPEATIVFEGLAAQDPEEGSAAHLEIANGSTDGWTLLDANDSEVRYGNGATAARLRVGLAPGTYTIIWDTENNTGQHAWVSADFTVR